MSDCKGKRLKIKQQVAFFYTRYIQEPVAFIQGPGKSWILSNLQSVFLTGLQGQFRNVKLFGSNFLPRTKKRWGKPDDTDTRRYGSWNVRCALQLLRGNISPLELIELPWGRIVQLKAYPGLLSSNDTGQLEITLLKRKPWNMNSGEFDKGTGMKKVAVFSFHPLQL